MPSNSPFRATARVARGVAPSADRSWLGRSGNSEIVLFDDPLSIRLLPDRRARGGAVTTTDAGLTSLVTQLGRARASAMDVPAVLGSICSAIPGMLGIGGAVLLLVNPPDGVPAITASDARALWLAETQQRTDLGPLAGALRTWRPMLTGDLTRIGPPAVAAAAVECGLG